MLRRCIKRLLRDYHFPKSVRQLDYTTSLGASAFTLPAGFKKEGLVKWYDPSDDGSWSDPLNKTGGFRRPQPDDVPRWYWLQGLDLRIDTPVHESMTGFKLQLFYESLLVQDVGAELGNEDWFTVDFEDVLFYYAVLKGAAEHRKPEVAAVFGPLWQDERASLAIFANELEWGRIRVDMREPQVRMSERYPKS